MVSYIFETMTAAQGLAITPVDELSMQAGTASAVTVIYGPGTATLTDSITIISAGHAVTFAPTMAAIAQGGHLFLPDGTLLYIGYTGGDTFVGGALADAAFGGPGADALDGGDGGDLLQGNQGADSLVGGAGADTIYGGKDDDVINLGEGANFGQGNMGQDTITGGLSAETILGGRDNDLISGGGGADFLNGNLGDDTVAGSVASDQILGEDGNDALSGLGGADTLSGGDGGDTISGGAGRDILSGGAGADQFVFELGSSGSTAGALDVINDWESGDRLDFAAVGAGYVEGSAATFADAATFANGQIAAGVDTVAVQVGADVVVFADTGADDGVSDDAVVLAGRTLADISAANVIDHTPPIVVNVNVITGTAAAETLVGAAGADSISALAGADAITGGSGADTLSGGDGGDTISGGAGADILSGGAGADQFVFELGSSGSTAGALDVINDWESGDRLDFAAVGAGYVEGSAATFADAATFANGQIAAGMDTVAVQVGADVVVFADTGADNGVSDDAVVLVARTLADISAANVIDHTPPIVVNVITGTAAAETLVGSPGADSISALAGVDSVAGLGGDDTIDAGIGADVIDGGAGADSIVAGDGADSIVGGSGDDALDGGIGADVFDGGVGADSLIFLAGGADVAHISAGDAGETAAATSSAGADSITGWSAVDHSIAFVGFAAGSAINYAEGAAPVANYAAAFAAADTALNGLGVVYYASEVTGVGVVLFHDTNGDGVFANGEDAVVLVGKTLADIGFANII